MPFPSTPLTGPLSTPAQLHLPSLASLSFDQVSATPCPSPAVQSLRTSTSRKSLKQAHWPIGSPRLGMRSPLATTPGDENVDSCFSLGGGLGGSTPGCTPAGLKASRTPASTPCNGCPTTKADGFAKQLEKLCVPAALRAPLSPSLRGTSLPTSSLANPPLQHRARRPSFRLPCLPVLVLPDLAASGSPLARSLPASVSMGSAVTFSRSLSSSVSHASSDATVTPFRATSGRLMHAGATPGVSTEDKQFFGLDDALEMEDERAHWADAAGALTEPVLVEVTTLGSYSPRPDVGEWRKARRGPAKMVTWCDEEGRSCH